MQTKRPNREEAPGLQCPACYSRDIVRALPRNFLDEVMRAWGRLPKHCRTCGRRFHARDPKPAAPPE